MDYNYSYLISSHIFIMKNYIKHRKSDLEMFCSFPLCLVAFFGFSFFPHVKDTKVSKNIIIDRLLLLVIIYKYR